VLLNQGYGSSCLNMRNKMAALRNVATTDVRNYIILRRWNLKA
jgi:hypothetical protein